MQSLHKFPNKTARFFFKLCLICYYFGMPNFWVASLPFPKRFDSIYRKYSRVITIFIYAFILTELTSLFTQNNLTQKQESNQMVFIMSHPMLWSYSVSFCRQENKVRKILTDIMKLKTVYNDLDVEKRMMKKSKYYSTAYCGMCVLSMVMYTFDAVVQVLNKEGTFTTVITVWPLVDDMSIYANLCRFLWNVLWWSMMIRVLSVYAFVFSITSCMSHQFTDLQSYFYSLERIFKNDGMDQRQKEYQYIAAYKIGIKLHADTIKCVKLNKSICGWIFSGQIIFNITMLVILMTQLLKAERSLMHVGAIGIAAICIVWGTGLCMCNAGDVTVEAAKLGNAMYLSGWENCQGKSSVTARKLVLTSMVFAQQPVVIKGLGIMMLSYESYVSLVKTTYSIFSLVFQQLQ